MVKSFFIITGLSGAGKTQSLKILEDFDFFCVDNLPVALIAKFADICLEMGGKLNYVAVGIDIRAGRISLNQLDKVLKTVKRKGINYKIVFIKADDSTLIKRYSETRRLHPLGKSISEGIKNERKHMHNLLSVSDKEIDTSYLTLGEFKEILARDLEIVNYKKALVNINSFGYRYGIPQGSDLVFDVRFLANPNYIASMRSKNGLNRSVKEYVLNQKITKGFYVKFFNMIDFLIPNYIKEGKSYLNISVGCTGGRHRSVVVAESLSSHLKKKGYKVVVQHRDIRR